MIDIFKIYLLFFILTNVYSNIINNEDQFLNVINENDEEIIINIESEINISNNINIINSFKKVSINGISSNISIIHFSDLSHQLYFSNNVEEIEIKNITVFGNININNNKKISIESTTLIGTILSNFTNTNEYVKFENFIYSSNSISNYQCVNIGGNVEINNSKFISNISCQKYLLNYDGLNKYIITVKNSYFSGEYKCPCLSIENSKNVNINNSVIEKGYIHDNDIDDGYII